jgi:hypothetical protein
MFGVVDKPTPTPEYRLKLIAVKGLPGKKLCGISLQAAKIPILTSTVIE